MSRTYTLGESGNGRECLRWLLLRFHIGWAPSTTCERGLHSDRMDGFEDGPRSISIWDQEKRLFINLMLKIALFWLSHARENSCFF